MPVGLQGQFIIPKTNFQFTAKSHLYAEQNNTNP